jgi:hypothetical protein
MTNKVAVCPYCELGFPHQGPTGCPPVKEWARLRAEEAAPACICDPAPKPGQLHYMSCPWNDASGVMCHAHFERNRGLPFYRWEQAACTECQQADQEAKDRIQRDHTIDPSQPYGAHIPLRCRNHRDLRWHTKNIDYIGARKVFFFGFLAGIEECPCPVGDLEAVPRGGE